MGAVRADCEGRERERTVLSRARRTAQFNVNRTKNGPIERTEEPFRYLYALFELRIITKMNPNIPLRNRSNSNHRLIQPGCYPSHVIIYFCKIRYLVPMSFS